MVNWASEMFLRRHFCTENFRRIQTRNAFIQLKKKKNQRF